MRKQQEKCDYPFKVNFELDFVIYDGIAADLSYVLRQKLILTAPFCIQNQITAFRLEGWKIKVHHDMLKYEKASTPQENKLKSSIPFSQTIIVPLSAPLSLCLVSLSLALYFSTTVTDWGGWVVMVTRSQYVARMQQREPEKEQPTLVTMVTHLLGLPSSSSFLRLWFLSLTGPRVSLSAAFALLSNPLWLSAHTLSLSAVFGSTSTYCHSLFLYLFVLYCLF